MEIAASVEGRPRRLDHRSRGNRFRAEIEMDRGSPSIPRGPDYGFAAAVREPLVRLQRPKFDFERWDWDYFAWPHDRLDANLEMRDSDPVATLEADRKASESFLNRSIVQLKQYEMDQVTYEQHGAAWPLEQLELHSNLEIKHCDPEASLEVDRNAIEGFLNMKEQDVITLPHKQHVEYPEATLEADRNVSEGFLNTKEQNAIILPQKQIANDQWMRDRNRKATLEPEQKASESLLSQRTRQLKRPDQKATLEPEQKASESLSSHRTRPLKRREMDQDHHVLQQNKELEFGTSPLLDGKTGSRPTKRRRGCAEANGILDHGRAVQGSWACHC